ncbi:MAG: hypothetical protein MPJ24_01535 [Pirellulaceae bacterium]|nr:hypothetical protein [Pirellulaceae bacterium]
MAFKFRIWGKKIRHRQTGSPLVKSLGETVFFAVLLLLGLVFASLVALAYFGILNENERLGFEGGAWWMVLSLSLSFGIIGGSGLVYNLFRIGISKERRAAVLRKASDIDIIRDTFSASHDYPSLPKDFHIANSPGTRLAFRLPARQSVGWRLIFITIFGTIWTIFSLGMLLGNFQEVEENQALGWFTLFFLAVSVWIIYYLIQQISYYFKVGATHLEVSSHPLRPGNIYELFISQAGRLEVQELQVFLVSQERCLFLSGTNSRAETFLTYKELLFEQKNIRTNSQLPYEAQFQFMVPTDSMHSFQSEHNSIDWELCVRFQTKEQTIHEKNYPIVIFPPED